MNTACVWETLYDRQWTGPFATNDRVRMNQSWEVMAKLRTTKRRWPILHHRLHCSGPESRSELSAKPWSPTMTCSTFHCRVRPFAPHHYAKLLFFLATQTHTYRSVLKTDLKFDLSTLSRSSCFSCHCDGSTVVLLTWSSAAAMIFISVTNEQTHFRLKSPH